MSANTTADEIGPETIEGLKEAGASNYFIAVVAADPAALGVAKNYAARKVARWQAEGREFAEAAAQSGHFMSALWDGDIAEALYRADATNSRILVRLFNHDVLLAALIEDRGSVESARSWLDPTLDRYGFGDDSDD